MLPYDITELLRSRLSRDRRPPDGLLHPSGDLIGSLRHAQLRAAGAPTIESDVVSDTRLMTGTMWHSFFESVFNAARLPVMTEVKLDRWLPEGWSGTADWLIWNNEPYPNGAFILGDLKTIKGEGMKYVQYEGIKDEHMWQLSAYWYALEAMGLPLVKGFAVYYLPQNAPIGENVEPSLQVGMPLPREQVIGRMEGRWKATQAYLAGVKAKRQALQSSSSGGAGSTRGLDVFINEHLAPEQDRVQIIRWVGKESKWEVKLAPHWSAMFCPYPTELCDCRSQGITKIGEFILGTDHDLQTDVKKPQVVYAARKGYEHVDPTVEPTQADIDKKWKELNA